MYSATLTSGGMLADAVSDTVDRISVRRAVPLRKDPLVGVWKILGASALYFLVDREGVTAWVRNPGRGAAIVIAAAGLSDLLDVKKEEDEES